MPVVYGVLAAYLAYAVLVAFVVWRSPVVPIRLPVVTHVVDLVALPALMYFTGGPSSPFFAFFYFSMLCATLRWPGRGTLWTGGAALAVYLTMGSCAAVLREPGFELNMLVMRSVFLGVVATLLASLGAHEQRLRREMQQLAAWPRSLPFEAKALARESLEQAAAILETPRMVAVWEEAEEPWLHVACWSESGFHRSREPPGLWTPLVAEALAAAVFHCPNVDAATPAVLHTTASGFEYWRGTPLHVDFRARFGVRAVLSAPLGGRRLEGRLFWLDRPGMTSDDLVLADVVTRRVAGRMDYYYLLKRLREVAVAVERVRLAHDLHDGLLQSLAAAALQLETLHRLLGEQPDVARERVREIQRLLAEEQRDLRSFIQDLKPSPLAPLEVDFRLATRLGELVKRAKRQWGLTVELEADPVEDRIPRTLAAQVYLMVHEAVVNVARHAQASAVRVELRLHDGRVDVTVADDGHGFPFRGHYDHATLARLKRGPMSLRDRITSLGGSLAIESTDSGSRLEITLPLAAPEA